MHPHTQSGSQAPIQTCMPLHRMSFMHYQIPNTNSAESLRVNVPSSHLCRISHARLVSPRHDALGASRRRRSLRARVRSRAGVSVLPGCLLGAGTPRQLANRCQVLPKERGPASQRVFDTRRWCASSASRERECIADTASSSPQTL